MTDGTPDDPGEIGRADAASPEEVDRLAAAYRERERPFARVTVVRREPPVSANVGDRAIVTPEGDLTGWIGGAACARSIAVDVATAALERDEPVLVGLAPDPDEVDRPGLEAYPMTCHSGGTLELFVEPVTPVPRLVVVGESPVARALARLAGELSYEVTVVAAPGSDPAAADVPGSDEVVAASDGDALAGAVDGATAVVVASMGEYDAAGLDAALRADVSYVGLVASDARLDGLADEVADRLDAGAVVAAVTTPAGLEIGAKTPEEIAVSILAELVAVRRGATEEAGVDVADASGVEAGDTGTPVDAGETGTAAESAHAHEHDATEPDEAETVVDPVCGMDVVVGEAAATVTHEGETYHFCGEGCAEAFEAEPERYRDEGVVTGG